MSLLNKPKLRPLPLLRLLSTSTETRDQKLNRIADDLLALDKRERQDYSVLFRLRLGITNWSSSVGSAAAQSSPSGSSHAEAEEEKVEKTAFDIKLEKFDAASKIKVIKEIRTFTDLGLKEAKDLVEKAPVVVKKGVLKEDAQAILAKLKDIGATAVLE